MFKQFSDAGKKHQRQLDAIQSQYDSATEKYNNDQARVEELEKKLVDLESIRVEAAKVPQLAELAQMSHQMAEYQKTSQQVSELEQLVIGKSGTIASMQIQLEQARKTAKEVEALRESKEIAAQEVFSLKEKVRQNEAGSQSKAVTEQTLMRLTKEVEEFQTKLLNAQTAAEQVRVLHQQAEERTIMIASLEQKISDASRTAHELESLKYSCSTKDAEIASLSERLEQMQGIENENHRNAQEMASLNNRLNSAEENLKQMQGLELANDRKDQELASLKERLRFAEEASEQLASVEQESQNKDAQLATLLERLIKLEQTSQQPTQAGTTTTNQDDDPSQGTMLAFQSFRTPEDGTFLTQTRPNEPPAPETATQPRLRANRSGGIVNQQTIVTTIIETSLIDIQTREHDQSALGTPNLEIGRLGHTTGSGFVETQEIILVPESQATTGSRDEEVHITAKGKEGPSSPLSSLEDLIDSSDPVCDQSMYFAPGTVFAEHDLTAADSSRNGPKSTGREIVPSEIEKIPVNFRSDAGDSRRSQREPPSTRPPSSSYGEPMLLEHLEEIENQAQYSSSASQKAPTRHQDPSISPEFLLPRECTDRVLPGKKERAARKAGSGPPSKKPSLRRLRSESRARAKMSIDLTERTPTDQNIPTTPRGGIIKENHLPNSAAKRRLETDDASMPSSSRDYSKRLKRDLSALEVPPTSKKTLVFGQGPSTTNTNRLNHPSMPTNSRRGSIIGANAPAPGGGQQAIKKSRKSLKNDQYSARFGRRAS